MILSMMIASNARQVVMTLNYLGIPSQSYFELVVQMLLIGTQHGLGGVFSFLLLFLTGTMLQGCFGRALMRVFRNSGQS